MTDIDWASLGVLALIGFAVLLRLLLGELTELARTLIKSIGLIRDDVAALHSRRPAIPDESPKPRLPFGADVGGVPLAVDGRDQSLEAGANPDEHQSIVTGQK